MQVRRVAGGDGEAVLVVTGELDLATASHLAEAVGRARGDQVSGIVIDLAGVEFLDSSGVRVLVEAAHESAEQNITLSVRGAHGMVAQVLEITGVRDFLRVELHQGAPSGGSAESARGEA